MIDHVVVLFARAEKAVCSMVPHWEFHAFMIRRGWLVVDAEPDKWVAVDARSLSLCGSIATEAGGASSRDRPRRLLPRTKSPLMWMRQSAKGSVT